MPPGPKTTWLEDANGRPVVGLRIHKKKDRKGRPVERYYTELPNGKRVYFGSDRTDAAFKFRQWEARQNKELVSVAFRVHPEPGHDATDTHFRQAAHYDHADEVDVRRLPPRGSTAKRYEALLRIPDDVLWTKFADLLRTTPLTIAAQKLGIPEVAHLTDLSPPDPPAKCVDVLRLYLGKRKSVKPEEARKVTRSWDQFAHETCANSLDQIDQDGIDRWERTVFDPVDNGHGKPKTTRHQVDRVTRVLRHAAKKRLDPRNAERVLAMIHAIDVPTAKSLDPRPISVADFRKLYKGADTLWRAILLTSLNCCFYPVDIRSLPIEAIDLKRKTLCFERGKTRVPRVAMLWPETVSAIKAWLKERGEGPGPVIRSSFGSGYSEEGFRGAFKRLRTQVGVKVTFAQIRDGAYTASCQVGIDERASKILAGHSSGTSDRYIMRNPQITQTAVDAIRHKYGIREPFRRK